jgi:hypothetical protein
LTSTATALREGKIYIPISDFDCPPTYLLPAGIVLLFTGWPPLIVHNLFFLVVFFFNGLFAFAFLRTLSKHLGLALLGALSYQGCNFVFWSHHMGHMNNIQLQWIPLICLAVWQLLSSGKGFRWAVLLGVGMGLQVLSSPYYTLLLCFATLPVFVLVYLGIAPRQRLLTAEYLIRFALQLVLAVRWWYDQPRPLTSAVGITMFVSLAMMLPAVPGTPFWFFYHLVALANRLRVPLRCFPIFHLMLISLTTLYLDHVFRHLSSIRKIMLAVGILLTLVGLNWLASPWAFNLDLVPIIKEFLNHH